MVEIPHSLRLEKISDLIKVEMLLNKEDIKIEEVGRYTVQTYVPTRTSIQFQWSAKTKQSDLPIQVIQRNEEGEVQDVFDFGVDEPQFWDAIAKFEQLIIQELENQGESEEEEPQGQNQSDSQQEQMDDAMEEDAKERGMSEDEIQDLMDELDNMDSDDNDGSDNGDGDSDDDGEESDSGDSGEDSGDKGGEENEGDGKGEGDAEDGEGEDGEPEQDGGEPSDEDGEGKSDESEKGEGKALKPSGEEQRGESEEEIKSGLGEESDEDAEDFQPYERTILEQFTSTNEEDLKYKYRTKKNVMRELESFSKSDYAEQGIDREEFLTKTKEYINKYF